VSERKHNDDSIGFWSVFAIGVGGMVGGGIFAVLGLAVQLGRGGTPVAFAVAGMVALVTSYSYARLSVAYPSQGGTVEFLNQGFGSGTLTGGLNVLLSLSYVVMLSLYAFAFGGYGASFFAHAAQPYWRHILASAVIVLFTTLNALGAAIVGAVEKWVVALKIAILFLFVGVGLWSVQAQRLSPSEWTAPLTLLAGGMVIFVAYEGFELIANTAKDTRNPRRTLPRAYYSAVGFVIVLYVLVALVTVGNLAPARIVAAKDYALAESARPFLGEFGFALIAFAALLSTSSAINATLYGAARISYIIAKDGQLPAFLERRIWRRPIEGLLITAALTLLIANLFGLSSISTMGSAGFLLIFAAVNAANLRLWRKTESRAWIPALGVFACLGALATLLADIGRTEPNHLWVLFGMVTVAFAIEVAYRRARRKG
jgi:amino acid transporter